MPFFSFFVIVLSIIFLFSYICTCLSGRGDASYNHGWENKNKSSLGYALNECAKQNN